MLPISASLSSTDQTSQTTGPAPQATAPVFSVVHQLGEDNTSNPTSSAAATATATPAGAAVADSGIPSWVAAVGVGLALAAFLGVVLGRKGAK